jgi:hypothetical protein
MALTLLGGLMPALLPGPLLGQKLQWTDMVYQPGRWAGGRMAPTATRNQATDSLALIMRVDYFAKAPRWRAEIRRSSDGQSLGEPDVLLGNGATVLVVTRLGTTPLAQHALSRDSLVRALAAVMGTNGRRTGVTNGRFAETRADGSVLRVAFRRSARAATFDDRLLDPRNASAGAQLISSRLANVGDQRSASVVATAGARGVDRVRTPGGEVPVTPDTMAVVRMERYAVGALKLEEFMRAGGLGPYKPERPDSARRDSAGARP